MWLVAVAWSASPEALFRSMREAEAAHDYAQAVALCRDLVAADPESPRAAPCVRRMAFLDARRDADGGFSGFKTLQQVRAAYLDGDVVAKRAQVALLLDDGSVAVTTRAEARVWLAAALVDEDPGAALVHARAVESMSVVREIDPAVRTQASQLEALALAHLGREEEALAVQARVQVAVAPQARRPTPVQTVLTLARRKVWAAVAGGLLVGLGIAALLLALAAVRQERFTPNGLWPLVVAAVGAGAVATAWDPTLGRLFVPWTVGLAAVHLLSAAALRTARRRSALRAAVRLGAGVATVAVTYVVWWWAEALVHVGL